MSTVFFYYYYLSVFMSVLLTSLNFYLKVRSAYLRSLYRGLAFCIWDVKATFVCEPNCLLQHKQKTNCWCYVPFMKHVKIWHCFDERHPGEKRLSFYFISLPLLDYLGKLSLNLWHWWELFEKFPLARPSLSSKHNSIISAGCYYCKRLTQLHSRNV